MSFFNIQGIIFQKSRVPGLNVLFQSIKEYYKNDIIIAPFQRAKYAYIGIVLQF